MRRADRLFQIVQFLRGGRLVTARALAEKLEVSERTIYRDIADLIGSGVPVEGEAGVGYVMRTGFELPPLMFTRAEVAALVTGARMLKSWGGAEAALAAEEALVKIEAVLPEALREAVLPEALREAAAQVPIHALDVFGLDSDTRALLDRIEAATAARERLALDYADAEGVLTQRSVRPLGLLYWGKVWTLAAWCELRNDFRMFRVDRIRSAEPGARFRPERDKSLAAFYAAQARSGRRLAD